MLYSYLFVRLPSLLTTGSVVQIRAGERQAVHEDGLFYCPVRNYVNMALSGAIVFRGQVAHVRIK